VAENARPPVAVRIVRPYETEEAFLENELETVGKTSVILIGAHPRPTGVILRFEVTLASGTTVLRGEGRVLAHKENAFRGQPGLALRFTRLDPRSKALVDRAAAIREARLADEARAASVLPPAPPAEPDPPPAASPQPMQRRGAAPADARAGQTAAQPYATQRPTAPSRSMPAPDPVLAEILGAPTPPPPQHVAPRSVPPPAAQAPRAAWDEEGARQSEQPASASEPMPTAPRDGPVPEAEPSHARVSTIVDEAELRATEPTRDVHNTATLAAPALPGAAHPSAPPPPAETPGRAVSAPTDREGLLARLRQRAAALTEEQVAAILRLGRS
jgi:hypothetical protein